MLQKLKGVELFKAYAQNQVDLATSKSVKEKLAEKFQLKVALTRREQWEGAVEEADMFLNKSAMERKIYFSQKLMSANKKPANKSEYLLVLRDFVMANLITLLITKFIII